MMPYGGTTRSVAHDGGWQGQSAASTWSGKVTFTGIAAIYMATIPDGKSAPVAGGSSVTRPGTVSTVTRWPTSRTPGRETA